MRELNESFQAILETMDPMQKQIVIGQMQNLLPTAAQEYMKKLCDGGLDEMLPPSTEDVKSWTTFYLIYFNA